VQVRFEDLTGFFRKPPGFDDLAFKVKDQRHGKNDILIIVPSYHDSFRLKKLLGYLKKQSLRRFDVAIILARDDEFVSEHGLSLCQIKRKVDCGFAGSVYLGQLLALKGKYKYYLFTDVDRVPHKSDVLALLHDTAEKHRADFVFGNNMVKGYFFPSGGFYEYENPLVIKSNCVFGLIRTSTLMETGLYALPLYIGYEDVEFEYRLRKAIKSQVYLDRTIYESYSSPAKNAFLKNFCGDAMGSMYVYPTMVCMFGSPQTASHLGLGRMGRMFFMVLLSQKFSALRMPELSKLEEGARRMQFAKTHAIGVSQEIFMRDAEKGIADDYKKYTANAPARNLHIMLSSLLRPAKNQAVSNYSPLFEFFMHDSFCVYDESRKRHILLEWERETGAYERVKAFCSALIGTALAIAKAAFLDLAGDRGMFDKYGLGAAGETNGLE
jgi:hypothetical protein